MRGVLCGREHRERFPRVRGGGGGGGGGFHERVYSYTRGVLCRRNTVP